MKGVHGMRGMLGAALLALALLAGCGSEPGSEFIGKWVDVKNKEQPMEIERNGKNFMIRQTLLSDEGKIVPANFPATFKDGVLLVSTAKGTIPLAIDKASGHLTGDGDVEYRRVK